MKLSEDLPNKSFTTRLSEKLLKWPLSPSPLMELEKNKNGGGGGGGGHRGMNISSAEASATSALENKLGCG